MKKDPDNLIIGNQSILMGERKRVELNLATLFDYTELKIPVEIIRSKKRGPVLFVSAAIHGDELNGVEIVNRLSKRISVNKLTGTLILVPVVNVFGFNNKSRYLPDRRDLNRSFPGSKHGSLASRIAYIFIKEIVNKSTHGIDLHTAAIHRTNLPQVRAYLDNVETRSLAASFAAPVVLDSRLRDASLREAARKKGVKTLLFEGGEALRHDEKVIKIGLAGCLRVMKSIGMLSSAKPVSVKKSIIAKSSEWLRAPHGGTIRSLRRVGEFIKKGDVLGSVTNLFGNDNYEIIAENSGVIIGAITMPLVNKGDAVFHIALFKSPKKEVLAVQEWDS